MLELYYVGNQQGSKEYCVIIDKKPGNDENNCLYVLKDINSDRQVTVDLTTLDWSPLRKEKVET